MEDLEDGFERIVIVSDIGEIDNARIVVRQLDHKIVEAAGTARVEEELMVKIDEPTGGIEYSVTYG